MPLLKDGRVVPDCWTQPTDEASLDDGQPVIVSLARWKADRATLMARSAPLGVRLEPGDVPEDLAEDLSSLAVVAVTFPTFTDGRGYSIARQLRERHGYLGEIRAVGDVLRDHIPLLRRCGFDTFLVSERPSDGAAGNPRISHYFQKMPDNRATVWERRRDAISR